MYMRKYFHFEKVHGYSTLFFVKRASSSAGFFWTLFKLDNLGFLGMIFYHEKAKKRVNVKT